MLKTKALSYRASKLVLVVFVGAPFARSLVANAHDSPAPVPAVLPGNPTKFESFILNDCTPCVRELYSIATVPIASTKAPDFSGIAPGNPATTTRAGELRFELFRAYPIGLESHQHLAMRIVLSVSTNSEGAQYFVGAGLLDEDEIPALSAALSQISKSMSHGTDDASVRLVDTEFHADSVRIGTVRVGNDVLGYVQVAPSEVPRIGLKQVWELPTMYFAVKDIPALEQGVLQVSAKIRAIRRR